MKLSLLLAVTICALHVFAQGPDKLYPFIQEGRWGYLDRMGRVAIAPQYRVAGAFSEGVAAVRSEGLYGFIDVSGNVVIEPAYDLARPFRNGRAQVFRKGIPFWIDHKGSILFTHFYKDIAPFGSHHYSVATTYAKHKALISDDGRPITDTLFHDIGPFDEGVAVATRRAEAPEDPERTSWDFAVIDTTGKTVVPFNRYSSISPFHGGFSIVRRDDSTDTEILIDRRGKERFLVPDAWYLDMERLPFSEGLAPVAIKPPDSMHTGVTYSHRSYMGILNEDGQLVASDLYWKEMTPFCMAHAFARDLNGAWQLIDRAGKRVGAGVYKEVAFDASDDGPASLFEEGIAFVQLPDDRWVGIDTNGAVVIQPRDIDPYGECHIMRQHELLILRDDISVENQKYSHRYGFWNTKSGILVAPRYHDIADDQKPGELIYVMKDGLWGYIDERGNQVWKEVAQQVADGNLNIDFMNRGYYFAGSPALIGLDGYGGHGSSDNMPVRATASGKNLGVRMKKTSRLWQKEYSAFAVEIVNSSRDTAFFEAQDGRIYMVMQARDEDGAWRDIEYTPSSWCGNSYHTLFLAPDFSWKFVAPRYEGSLDTKLRLKLLVKKNRSGNDLYPLYSNEMDGSINPGQFWNKLPYSPKGIMDPYRD